MKKSSVVDLLRITHTYQFECYIYHTVKLSATTVKDNLISIVNGAGVNSTNETLTYKANK